MTRELILITGRNRAGKTSLAMGLIELLRKRGNIPSYLPFAKPLKDDLLKIGFSQEYLDKKTKKARALMRAYGDARREEDKYIFLKKWGDLVENVIGRSDFVIADDMYLTEEFAHSLQMAKRFGIPLVKVILVRRPSLPALSEDELKFETVSQQQYIESEIYKALTGNDELVIDIGDIALGNRLPVKLVFKLVVNDYPSVEDFVSNSL